MASIQSISSVSGRSDSLCESSKARTKSGKWSEADGLPEVGLFHSSDEAHESAWSKGNNNSALVGRKTCKILEVWKAWNMNEND